MKASNKYKAGMHCAVCDCILTDPNNQDKDTAFTIDHVYPQSLETKYVRVQALCRRCNQLKSNHIPTATLMRLIRSVRLLESSTDCVCTSIECIVDSNECLTPEYRIRIKGVGCIATRSCSCFDFIPAAKNNDPSNLHQLELLIGRLHLLLRGDDDKLV